MARYTQAQAITLHYIRAMERNIARGKRVDLSHLPADMQQVIRAQGRKLREKWNNN